MIGYVIIKTLPFYGIHAIPLKDQDGEKRKFILLEKHALAPDGFVWLERKDLG